MSDERDTTLRDLIQDNVDALGPDDTEDGPFFFSSAVLLTEWIDANGDRWFIRYETDEEGGRLASWRGRGLATEYLEQIRLKQTLKALQGDDDE